MRLSRLGLVLVLLSSARGAFAQVPVAPTAPAAEPTPPSGAPLPKPAEPPSAPAPPPPGEVAETPPPVVDPAPPVAEPTPPPLAEPAPEPATAPEPAPPPPESLPLDAAGTVARPATSQPAASPPWPRAHSPLTLEGRLGFLVRPDSGSGFDHETNLGAELGFSLYMALKRELAAGLELERTSLGRGTAIHGLDSVNVDYTVSSAMLGLRAYPKRTELLDLFVGLQVGVGIQGVAATGTTNNGSLLPASPYSCGASDAPAFQIGGGIGARLMLTPRWGLTARLNGTGRRLTGEMVEDCAQGIGTATTVSAGLGLGYDFDLDP
jgi:hypothetical protein